MHGFQDAGDAVLQRCPILTDLVLVGIQGRLHITLTGLSPAMIEGQKPQELHHSFPSRKTLEQFAILEEL